MRRHSSFSGAVILSGAQRSRRIAGSHPEGMQRDSSQPSHKATARQSTSLGMTTYGIVALAFSLFSSAGLLRAQEQSATTISREVKDVFDRASKAVVKIEATDQ